MNKNQETKKRTYVRPSIEIVGMQTESLLQQASGQHEHIGQGGTTGDAKRGFFDFEEEEKENSTLQGYNLWED